MVQFSYLSSLFPIVCGASVIRSQLNECISGEYKGSCPKGWQQRCLDHSQYKDSFDSLCKESDLFLARHGIIREGQRYSMETSKYDTKSRREMRIAVFCHGKCYIDLDIFSIYISYGFESRRFWLDMAFSFAGNTVATVPFFLLFATIVCINSRL